MNPARPSVRLLCTLLLACVLLPAASATAADGDHPLTMRGRWLSDHEVRLTWNPIRSPLVLERRVAGEPYFESIAVIEPRRTEYTAEGLKVNTTYEFRLRTDPTYYLDEYGPQIKLSYDLPAPKPPEVKRAGIDAVTVGLNPDTVRWNEDTSIQMRIEGVFEEVGRINETDSLVFIDGLEVYRPQLFRALYMSETNVSEPSVPDTSYLSFPPPRDLHIRVLNDHSIELSWSPPTDYEHAYQVEKLEGADTTKYNVNTGDTSWVDDDVDFDRRTFYRVRGISGENIGEFSGVISARLQMNTVENLDVDRIEDLTVQLSWNEPAPVSTTYYVQRSINGGPFETIAELPSSARAYTDSLARGGLNVAYRIQSANSRGNRIVSEPVSHAVRTVAQGMIYLQVGPRGDAWLIDADEISASEFTRFCDETGRDYPEIPDFSPGAYWIEGNLAPAVMVTWDDAIAFCNWRSRSMGLEPAYDDSGRVINESGGFRLPSRALLALAVDSLAGGASAAKNGANLLGREDGYHWLAEGLGDDINPQHPVHLIGNVWEWVQDEVGGGGGRLAVGGAFSTPSHIIAGEVPDSAHPRGWYAPTIGFRCVLPVTVAVQAE